MKLRTNAAERTGPQATEQFDYRDCKRRRAFAGGCFWEKLVGYSFENMLVRPGSPAKPWACGTAGWSGRCEICFRRTLALSH